MAKDDIDGIDIEVFPDKVNQGKDSRPPDINPDIPYKYSDNPGKGRISLLKRSPHCIVKVTLKRLTTRT